MEGPAAVPSAARTARMEGATRLAPRPKENTPPTSGRSGGPGPTAASGGKFHAKSRSQRPWARKVPDFGTQPPSLATGPTGISRHGLTLPTARAVAPGRPCPRMAGAAFGRKRGAPGRASATAEATKGTRRRRSPRADRPSPPRRAAAGNPSPCPLLARPTRLRQTPAERRAVPQPTRRRPRASSRR
jgi:hypothetical protein